MARQVEDYDLLRLADLFVSHGHSDLAERLIRERAQTSRACPEGPARRDSRLTVWLKDRAQARGDLAEALSLPPSTLSEPAPPTAEASPPARKLGRNDPCWRGSGKKYKHCHQRSDQKAERSGRGR